MYSFKSLEKVHSIFFEPLMIGTTFLESPSILTVFAGLSSLMKSVSKTHCPCIPLCWDRQSEIGNIRIRIGNIRIRELPYVEVLYKFNNYRRQSVSPALIYR